jgi:hypothetical protein
VRFYLGGDLEPKPTDSGFDFVYEDRLILTLLHTRKRIDPYRFTTLATSALRGGAPAVLLATMWPSPFRIEFALRDNKCWTPIVSWGKSQFEAIASLNRAKMQDILPYANYTVRTGSSRWGSGSVLWSDIIGFTNRGIRIADLLGWNPVRARSKLIRDIDKS